MRLAAESHALIERFLRERFDHPTLVLPAIFIHDGIFAGWLTRIFQIGAITFGTHILIAPKLVERDENNRLTLPGWLMAHEAAHVWQYECAGVLRFLLSYLAAYFCALWSENGWNKEARMNAYLSIKEECDARACQHAYAGWLARESCQSTAGEEN